MQNEKKKIFITDTGKYLRDYTNVNDKNNKRKADVVWNLISEPPFEPKSIDEVYINDLPDKILKGGDFITVLFYNIKSILKEGGLLKVGLATEDQKERIENWLAENGFSNIESCKYDETVYPAETIAPTVKNKLVKLNVGCGTKYFNGWTNIDNNSDNNIEKLDLNFDLRNALPYPENSVDYIFNEHFIEHLTVAECRKTLLDFRRILKPTGILRIAMPSLTSVLDFYNDKNWKEAEFLKKFGFGKYVKTRAEMLNMNFRAWGHKWLYDEEELERRLLECGYHEIKFCKLHESENENLRNLETRDESILIAEAKKKEDFDNTQFI